MAYEYIAFDEEDDVNPNDPIPDPSDNDSSVSEYTAPPIFDSTNYTTNNLNFNLPNPGDVLANVTGLNCEAQGLVTCSDGTCVSDKNLCNDQIDTGRFASLGDEEYIQQEGEDPDQSLLEIYNAIGGMDWTGKSFTEWKFEYEEDFPTWEGSLDQQKFINKETDIGNLETERLETLRLNELKDQKLRLDARGSMPTGREREAALRSGGGLKSGSIGSSYESAYDRVLSGFDIIAEQNSIALSQNLTDIETRSRNYDLDLDTIVSSYQDDMDILIADQKEAHDGCLDRDDDGTCLDVDWGLTRETLNSGRRAD